MPGLKDLVDQASGTIVVIPPKNRPNMPAQYQAPPAKPLYGRGPGKPSIKQLEQQRFRQEQERNANPYYLPGEIDPAYASGVGGGHPEAFKYASGEREAQALWRDGRVLRDYERYLQENGVDEEQMDEIIRDILLQQKKAREEEYNRPVELQLVDNNPTAMKPRR